jgi:hypothetical protein
MTYGALCDEVKKEFPTFSIVYKDESWFMKLLDVLLRVVTFGSMKVFMTSFITTIGYTVYVPMSWGVMMEHDRIEVLRHERIHMRQRRRYSAPLFTFLYLVPFFPLGLAYFRARFEWEAYTESMKAVHEIHGAQALQNPKYKEQIVSYFVTGAYGWMWPFRATIERWYDEAANRILSS